MSAKPYVSYAQMRHGQYYARPGMSYDSAGRALESTRRLEATIEALLETIRECGCENCAVEWEAFSHER